MRGLSGKVPAFSQSVRLVGSDQQGPYVHIGADYTLSIVAFFPAPDTSHDSFPRTQRPVCRLCHCSPRYPLPSLALCASLSTALSLTPHLLCLLLLLSLSNTDGSDNVVGTFCDSDYVYNLSNLEDTPLSQVQVGECMTTPVVMADASASVNRYLYVCSLPACLPSLLCRNNTVLGC